MKKIVFAVFLFFVFCGPAYAISEAEFQKLYKSSPVLQKADKILNQTWKEVNNKIPKKEKKNLLGFQREWVRSGRDETADEYLGEGYGKACAYAIATLRWAKNLRVMQHNYNLSEEDIERGAAKADDAFWNEDEDIPAECRPR